MPDTPVDRWPHFELVTFSEPTGIPFGWDKELVSKGVPKDLLGRYNAAHELTLLEVPNYGPLVCFGTTMLHDEFYCQDPHTGAIVVIAYMRPNTVKLGPGYFVGLPSLVNSSLDQFMAAVRAVFARFPFDSGDTGEVDLQAVDPASEWARVEQLHSEWDRAAEDLTEILGSIDRVAVADETTFWREFLADMQIGDLATQDVLGYLSQ